jgi:hypothetical protein
MEAYTTVTEALNGLREKGYTLDFNLKQNCIECKAMNINLHPSHFAIDEFHRFEGASNPDDNSIVFAISSTDGLKGTLVDAYGVYSDSLSEEMISKLKINR